MKTSRLALVVLTTGLLCVGNAGCKDEKKAESDAAVVRFEKTLAEAKDGDVVVMVDIGSMYANGEGVLEDDEEAVKWYHKAAELGNAEAMFNLGVMYAKGEGVIKDGGEAYAWWNTASAKGLKKGATLRDKIKKNMTSEQIAEGQKRSREIMKSISKNNPLADTDIISTN